tara:strand:+ start:866 stop:1129 length:264 start_codon:yes stop_codon:yes gene_type:complete
VDAGECDPAIVAQIVAIVENVATVIGRRVRVQVEPVIRAEALVGAVGQVEVHANPDRHIARSHVVVVHNDALILVVDYNIDARGRVE